MVKFGWSIKIKHTSRKITNKKKKVSKWCEVISKKNYEMEELTQIDLKSPGPHPGMLLKCCVESSGVAWIFSNGKTRNMNHPQSLVNKKKIYKRGLIQVNFSLLQLIYICRRSQRANTIK